MNPIVKIFVAALLLTGSAVGTLMPAVNKAPPATPIAATASAEMVAELSAEEATAIALNHAGLTAEQVTALKVQREMDDGVAQWEVEFRCGDYEYDYTIHAQTGKILERERDYEPRKEKPVQPPVTAPETQPEQTPVITELTAEEALEIALTDAGLAVTQVTDVRNYRETDDGVPEWEVEFRCGDYEYDYTIHAQTGKILGRDRDYEPQAVTPAQPPAAEQKATKLTRQEALAIALAHAGLTADDVKRIECEYDVDDGVPEWEIEFRCGGMEYEYTIHAETGTILEWDRERDD